ncbi:hypothetical protein [Nonomuraea pusilla]|uniref:Uncharacterized protein n=1 Tax=Nonomuraea pusilla TaxID=46177 RepID=A0A1H8JEH6_9ACTN|nr:hypothetical protein [Nonomuraea pusilla]SEN78617.1 hypothetical protein SAMN05660976_08312 [Nonomuraea pusilla]
MRHTDTADRRAVEPGHARSLADHGFGWAIMWDDRHDQPVIVRPEHGDDGTLLEICTYEEMFTLGGHCATREDARTCEECMPGGQPDFKVIANHMTDMLGDHYICRDDIAACMPLTVPYTRALTAYGYQRRAQGGPHCEHTFHQRYVSPEGHPVELIMPISPIPDDPSAPPLTIEWTYLGHIGPEGAYPVTDLPADTPPADVAELIATHVAIHPPAPSADTTNGTDAPTGAEAPITV